MLLALAAATLSQPVHASLVGQSFDFNFMQTGPDKNASDLNRAYNASGAELAAGDGGNIDGIGALLNGSSIDILSDSIEFSLRGGGAPHSTGFESTGFSTDARFRISGFGASLNSLFEIAPGDVFALEFDNLIGVALGTQLVLNNDDAVAGNNYIDLFVGSLGIGTPLDIGSVTLKVDRAMQPPSAIPLPAALPLMLTALGLLGLLSRRRRASLPR